jgi:hypothetical protein
MRVASSSKTAMNSAPMRLRLVSGSVTPASCARKRSLASTATMLRPSLSRRFFWTLEFVFAQDAVVDEDAGELAADGLVDEHGGDGGIDAAGETADDVARADLLADPSTVVSMKCAGSSRRRRRRC